MTGRADHKPGSPEWASEWRAYRATRAPFDAAVRELQAGSGDSLNVALRFLEERPRFLQSGYIVERMLRFLDRPAWNEAERSRVVRVARLVAEERHTREAKEARKLLVRLDEAREES